MVCEQWTQTGVCRQKVRHLYEPQHEENVVFGGLQPAVYVKSFKVLQDIVKQTEMSCWTERKSAGQKKSSSSVYRILFINLAECHVQKPL